jgi:hypothetical protein
MCSNVADGTSSATLAWDANTEPDIAGYRLHYGTQSGRYTVHVEVGNRTTYTVTGLDAAQNYYFAVQAYVTSGLTSPMSAEVKLPAVVSSGTTSISSLRSSAAFPLLLGQPVTWTAAATSTRGPVEYKFLLHSARGGWVTAQDYGPLSTFTWTPTWNDLGAHYLQVWVRTVGSPAGYEAWIGTELFNVNSAPVKLTADVDFPTPPGQPVRWTAEIAGAPGAGVTLEYRFVLLNQDTGTWSIIREWGANNSVVWTPSATGNFVLQVWARRVGSTATYEVWGSTPALRVARTALEISRIDADKALPAMTGSAITWKARIKGGTAGPVQYQFVRYSVKRGWEIVRAYSPSNTYSWTPGWADDGQYIIQVWARNANSTIEYDAWRSTGYFEIQRAPIHLTTQSVFPVPPGTTVAWTASVPDSTVSLEYQYLLYTQATGQWAIVRPYSSTRTFTWTPSATGRYVFQVWARRVGSTAGYEVWRGTDYLNVSRTSATMNSLTPDVSLPARVGTPIRWTAIGSGGTASPLQYRFLLYTDGIGWTVLREWSSDNVFTWTPSASQAGQHALQVWVRSAGSALQYEGWIGSGYCVIYP